jgi:hypothetical protein
MVKVRKAIKGAAGKGKKASGPPETEQEAALRREMQALAMEEEMRKRMEQRRKELKRWQEEEEKFAKLNRYRINNQWRKLMRLAKVESLRKELEILSQSHEREVDMKDAIIQMLDRDLDEAEEQYSMALRSHLSNVDALIELHNTKVRTLESEFDAELHILQREFDSERQQEISRHSREKKELLDIMSHVENEFNDQEAEARQEFESQCEEMKNKAMEELNLLNMVMMATIEELERHFESAHHHYVNTTESKTQKFKALSQKDKASALDIQRKTQRLLKLQDSVNNWKMKIAANVRECEERNRMLREEKESISRHFGELKAKMNKFRDNEGKLLTQLSTQIRRAMQTLEKQQKQAERIMKVAELNRKLETEQEKVMPFSSPEDADGSKVPVELQNEANQMCAYAKGAQGQTIEEWNYLDMFFKRFNKVALDNIALDNEKASLSHENEDLRSILKQYLDGISVTEDVLGNQNALLVVNNRTNIVHRQPMAAQQIPMIEANTVVGYTAKMKQPLVQTDLGGYW